MKIIDGLHYADDMKEWSYLVAKRYQGRCAWPGCSSTFGLGGHHVISRRYKNIQLLIENGVELCTEHHGIVEAAKNTQRYDTMMIILVGRKRYAMLRRFLHTFRKNAEYHMVPPSSTIEGVIDEESIDA